MCAPVFELRGHQKRQRGVACVSPCRNISAARKEAADFGTRCSGRRVRGPRHPQQPRKAVRVPYSSHLSGMQRSRLKQVNRLWKMLCLLRLAMRARSARVSAGLYSQCASTWQTPGAVCNDVFQETRLLDVWEHCVLNARLKSRALREYSLGFSCRELGQQQEAKAVLQQSRALGRGTSLCTNTRACCIKQSTGPAALCAYPP